MIFIRSEHNFTPEARAEAGPAAWCAAARACGGRATKSKRIHSRAQTDTNEEGYGDGNSGNGCSGGGAAWRPRSVAPVWRMRMHGPRAVPQRRLRRGRKCTSGDDGLAARRRHGDCEVTVRRRRGAARPLAGQKPTTMHLRGGHSEMAVGGQVRWAHLTARAEARRQRRGGGRPARFLCRRLMRFRLYHALRRQSPAARSSAAAWPSSHRSH